MSALPMGELLRALAAEIARSEEFRTVVREELAARQPAGTELVSTAIARSKPWWVRACSAARPSGRWLQGPGMRRPDP
jgi:hypothetical protein